MCGMKLRIIDGFNDDVPKPLIKVDKEVPCVKDKLDFYGILYQDEYSSEYYLSIYDTYAYAERKYEEMNHIEEHSIDPVEIDRIKNQYRQLIRLDAVRTDDSGSVHLFNLVTTFKSNTDIEEDYGLVGGFQEFVIEDH